MALRSPALWMGNPAVQHTAQNDRLMLGGLLRGEAGQTAATRPLASQSGALHGPPGTMGEVTLLSNTQFTVNPARWVVQAAASALGGMYEVTNDAVETLGITAQDATQFRRSYFGVWVVDSFVAGSGDDLPHRGLVDGVLAASAAAAALPSAGVLPANFLALGEFLIPPVGQAVTWTPYSPRTGLRGGILPVIADGGFNPGHEGFGGSYVGQYRDHPTYGLERWDANGRWTRPVIGNGWITPAGAQGDAAYNWGVPNITWTDAPGMIGDVVVPAGFTLEVEFRLPMIRVEGGATVDGRLVVAGTVLDAFNSATAPGVAAQYPFNRLRGELAGTGASVHMQAQGRGSGGLGAFRGIESIGPQLRYRIV